MNNNSRPTRTNNPQRTNNSVNQAKQAPVNSSSRQNNEPIRNTQYNQGGGNISSANNSGRKKLVIALGAIAALAAAAGTAFMISNMGKVVITGVSPYAVTTQQPYQACHEVGTTSMVRNHKDGTKGAVIGGVSGAAVGGVIGGVATHTATGALIGAGIGGAVGAVSGDLIEKSREPDYIKKHGHKTECATKYRDIQVPVGYQVSYMQDNAEQQIITQHAPEVGSKVKLEQLQADQVTPQQQQQLVQQALSGGTQPQAAAIAPQ